MRDDDTRVPEPPVVDVRDWPPRSRTDDAREQLDREVGTLGIGGSDTAATLDSQDTHEDHDDHDGGDR
jgi:hypothetical protein